ncbi:MAG: glycosyltransferase family 4 protein [Sulfurisoma sp.]|nr:glycosyltransferase family 4 protein [Sulfurisoma sp.]
MTSRAVGRTRPKLLYLVTEDGYFRSHRLPLARAALAAGYDVVLVTRVSRHRDEIEAAGIRVIPLDWERSGVNPWRESRTLARLHAIYRRERPDLVHHVAVKPVIHGGLVAALTGVPVVVNALAGLGYAFTSRRLGARLLAMLLGHAYRLLLRRPTSWLILQNDDDAAMFARLRLVDPARIRLIRGVGIDPGYYRAMPEPEGRATVLLPARMLWDKGVGDFVAAARLLKDRAVDARCVLCGDTDSANPTAISTAQLKAWRDEGVVEWWGWIEDMRQAYSQAHVVCLPSYREGLPKALLEAAGCGRPLVATDVPGCREVVSAGENGLLVPAGNPEALAAALAALIGDPAARRALGANARRIVERDFSVAQMNTLTLELYRDAIESGAAGASGNRP